MKFISIFILIYLMASYTFSFGAGEHDHSKHEHNHTNQPVNISKNKILTENDLTVFINLFNKVEIELNKVNLTQFNHPENFAKNLNKSENISADLKQENISAENYAAIFNSVTAAYNEIKMARFEDDLRHNKRKKFAYRENLVLDHSSPDHQILHKIQEKNFSETFSPEGWGDSGSEPKENLMLVGKHEGKLDELFKN